MMRLIKTALPIVLGAAGGQARKQLPDPRQLGRKLVLGTGLALLLGLGLLAFTLAGFVWIGEHYGYDLGFVALGCFWLLLALITYIMLVNNSSEFSTDSAADDSAKLTALQTVKKGPDPIKKLLPDDLSADGTVQEIMNQVNARPLIAVATAMAVGFALTSRH